jgi:phosphate acetyltransferase
VKHSARGFVELATELCRRKPKSIALPESMDIRTLHATEKLLQSGAASSVYLFGSPDEIRATAAKAGINWNSISSRILFAHDEIPDLGDAAVKHFQDVLSQKGKSCTDADLAKQRENQLLLAGELLYQGRVDAALAGAISTTADVIRAAISSVGLAAGCRTVSGSFVMDRPAANGSDETLTFLYGDCGVVVDPTPVQLADIAWSTVQTWNKLLAETRGPARVAFLSFSTKGSAMHARVEKVQAAYEIFTKAHPEVLCDGELQFDAAFVPSVSERKSPQSPIKGRANCFIFPDLDAGNIGYKITQRLGGFDAFGPILQGLKRPYSDLSRGASVEDIFASAIINLLRAEG